MTQIQTTDDLRLCNCLLPWHLSPRRTAINHLVTDHVMDAVAAIKRVDGDRTFRVPELGPPVDAPTVEELDTHTGTTPSAGAPTQKPLLQDATTPPAQVLVETRHFCKHCLRRGHRAMLCPFRPGSSTRKSAPAPKPDSPAAAPAEPRETSSTTIRIARQRATFVEGGVELAQPAASLIPPLPFGESQRPSLAAAAPRVPTKSLHPIAPAAPRSETSPSPDARRPLPLLDQVREFVAAHDILSAELQELRMLLRIPTRGRPTGKHNKRRRKR